MLIITKESQYRPSFLLLDMHEGLFIPEISTYSIYDVYKIDKNSDEVEIVEFGDWNTATGLTVAEENIWKRRSNLKGHHLKYVIECNLSIVHIFYFQKCTTVTYSINFDLIEALLPPSVHRLQRILKMAVKLQIVSKESLLTHFINYMMQ